MSNLSTVEELDLLHAMGAYPNYGGRRLAEETGISYGRVRRYLENQDKRPRVTTMPPTPTETPSMITKVWDIETTNLRSDIGTLLIASFLDLGTNTMSTKTIVEAGELELVLWVKEQVTEADILIGHNSLAFDKNFINGVLGRYFIEPLPPRFHIDTYMTARYGFKGIPQSYALDNLADLFQLSEQKDKPSKHDWRAANILSDGAVQRLAERCESDVRITALLWQKLKPYYMRWRGH